MNRSALPTLIGVFTSLLAIWLIHSYLIIDDCIANTGDYDYSTGKCLLENGQLHESDLASFAIGLYFFVGFVVALLVSHVIRKFFKIER